MSSNSVCNYTRDKQITHGMRSSDFVITRMFTDRIGLLLPLLIVYKREFQAINLVNNILYVLYFHMLKKQYVQSTSRIAFFKCKRYSQSQSRVESFSQSELST